MNSKEVIAILMATYNGELYIKEQIDSILCQSNANWKLFIRDDGSLDCTLPIIKEYVRNNANIVLIEDQLGGLGTRDQFLHLLNVVDADYYMFCDQDDVWFHDKIEKSINKIKEVEKLCPGKAVLIGSDCSICGPYLEVVNQSCWDHLRIQPREFLTINGIYVYPFVTGASMILNKRVKDILPKLPQGLPKNRPMYDWWILLNTYKYGIVELIEEPTRYYRQHSANVSGGVDKLNTSYISKFGKLGKVWKSNVTRAKVLKKIGCPPIKYYFYKMVYLWKMMCYKHK